MALEREMQLAVAVQEAMTPLPEAVPTLPGLRAAGWTGPWGVEILSAEHRSLPVKEALSRAAGSARRQLDHARDL